MTAGDKPVVILGAGINGCAIARELLLSGVSVWLIDAADIASGATAASSRLIHGGLRYLEFGELGLVKESLQERSRLLRLAPQFVHALQLWIPSATRFGGLSSAPGRFFGWSWWPQKTPKRGRGVSLIGAGLTLYDAYARDPLLPKHCTTRAAAAPIPVDRGKYRWLSSYYDGQVTFPERLVLAMLEDARRLAESSGADFRVFTYHEATLERDTLTIRPTGDSQTTTANVQPACIVNATGAWVDETLQRLHVDSRRLMGGTKGSHVFTFKPELRDALAGQGIYAEAPDGRPIFITPLADCMLIGTTDIPFDGPPETATVGDREIDYLLDAVNDILPEVKLNRADVAFHYSGVRPLPFVSATSPAAITRRHSLVQHEQTAVPLLSVVGGKLTTMRSLAEMTAAHVLKMLARQPSGSSRERLFPGAENYPGTAQAVEAHCQAIAARTNLSPASVQAVWRLFGTRTETVLQSPHDRELLPGSDLPCAAARWAIRHEWAHHLADLVERRLMLLYDQHLTKATLVRLAELLSQEGLLRAEEQEAAVARQTDRLATHFGKRVES